LNKRQACHALGSLAGEQAARWLLEHITGDQSALNLDGALSNEQSAHVDEILARLRQGEPVQYILGSWDFYGYRFKVDKRALIPRPETELLVEAALGLLQGVAGPRVADLGAGTGCIGITLKKLRPDAAVELYDISEDACSLAKENARLLNADVVIENCDMRELSGRYDMILSNPPYIASADLDALDDSVRLYEPHLALDGGPDGLRFCRVLRDLADRCLADRGCMAFEIGAGQRNGIEKLFSPLSIMFQRDLRGIDRIAMIQK